MAVENDPSYRVGMNVNLALELARVLRPILVRQVQTPLVTIPVAESELIPKGAISTADAIAIGGLCNEAAAKLLFAIKSDGKPSASPNPPGVPLCRILRTNNVEADRTLYCDVTFKPLGYPDFIVVNITPEVA